MEKITNWLRAAWLVLAVAAVVILGLFCRHPEPRIELWCALALVWVLAGYVALSLALETVM